MSWIATYSGNKFDLVNPEAADVHIEDIAHALSLQCRFAGHTREFYSVAQHSVLVSKMVPRSWALEGLLHDGAEAYLGDVTRPLKALLRNTWESRENLVLLVICQRFNLRPPWRWDAAIDLADKIALAGERRDLLNPGPMWTNFELPDPPAWKIEPVSPAEAERMFLERFRELEKLQAATASDN